MKRHPFFFALAIIPIGLFFAARQAASWRPVAITKAEFDEQLQLEPNFLFFAEESKSLLSASQLKLKQLAVSKGWFPRALSLDGKQMLAEGKTCAQAAILNTIDASVIAKMTVPPASACKYWGGPQFSSDGRWVMFSQDGTATHLFDARSGQYLWSSAGNNIGRFAPDCDSVAFTDWKTNGIEVRDVATGRQLRRLTFASVQHRWNFSRDGNYLLVAVAPGQYRRARLR